jgi:hypothetical protein
VLLGFGWDNGWVNPLDSLDVKGLGFRVGSIEWEGGKRRAKCCSCHAMLFIPSPYSLPKTYNENTLVFPFVPK